MNSPIQDVYLVYSKMLDSFFFIVYTAKKSIAQLRQLYFKMKDEIFGKARLGGISFNTVGLEKILKDEFTERVCMDDESYPR